MDRTRAGAPARARRHVAAVFFVHGMLFASWTAHIPQIKGSLGLDDGSLGLALLGAPVGSVLAVLAGAAVLARIGSRVAVPVTTVGYALAGILVGQARTPLELAAALAVWGAFQGSLDVSMNTQGIAVEGRLGRPIMSGLHGSWSLGSFAGAGLGALAVALGISLTAQLLVLGPLAGALALAVPGPLLADRPGAVLRDAGARVALRTGMIWLLGAIALAAMLCEGAAADWSAVWLRSSLHAPAGLSGLGYAVFSAGMVSVRLAGDRLLAAQPARRVLALLAAVATTGMTAALAASVPAAALGGLACLGVGLALIVPTAFSAAGRLAAIPTGTAVAAVSGIGWTGFVGGPPLIGRLAQGVSLPTALILVPVLMAAIAVAVRATRAFAAPEPRA